MTPFLQFHNVSYSYPHQQELTLTDLSFSLSHGEFLGILAADDAGKTTLAKLANGLLLPLQGNITIRNHQQNTLRITSGTGTSELLSVRKAVGVVFSDPENQIVGTTVEEDLAFGLGNLGISSPKIRERVDRYLSRLDLLRYARRAPRDLSGGEQQKLCLGGVLAMEPECLVLDEPLSFLDSQSREEILAFLMTLNKEGQTILYLTSDPEELLDAQRILLLCHGTILAEYSPYMVWNNPGMFEEAGVLPSDMMRFRHRLLQRGYFLQEDSLTPETIVRDMCRKM